MTFENFKNLSETYNAIPVSRRLFADVLTPVSLFLTLREGARYPFLFESVEGGERLARYSFLGRDPYQVLISNPEKLILKTDKGVTECKKSYFETLRDLTTAFKEPDLPGLPNLTGGAVGYSSYDTVRQIEYLPDIPDDDTHLPDAVWAFYNEIIAFDHVKQQLVLMHTVFIEDGMDIRKAYDDAQKSLDKLEASLNKINRESGTVQLNSRSIRSNMSRDHFMGMVEKAKKYIYEGDIFQVVLSQRFEVPFSGDRFMLYRALRVINPSPYLFFLDFEEYSLIGSSPEVLVSLQNRKARLLPIAGTRPRGGTEEEDIRFEEELKIDPKEIAEHIMLVDLGRNDLSRVCQAGTVIVERDQVIERYSHVMHIVSEVTGLLSEDRTAVDTLMQCFPAGTVSGAPKIRAMEIIDELETTKRGPYAGAVGYFDFSGNMDTCIAIRTMIATHSKVYIQAGAGIVADSDPAIEFEETKNKAAALIDALHSLSET